MSYPDRAACQSAGKGAQPARSQTSRSSHSGQQQHVRTCALQSPGLQKWRSLPATETSATADAPVRCVFRQKYTGLQGPIMPVLCTALMLPAHCPAYPHLVRAERNCLLILAVRSRSAADFVSCNTGQGGPVCARVSCCTPLWGTESSPRLRCQTLNCCLEVVVCAKALCKQSAPACRACLCNRPPARVSLRGCCMLHGQCSACSSVAMSAGAHFCRVRQCCLPGVTVCEACSILGPQAHGIWGDRLCVCSPCVQQPTICKILLVV